MKTMLRIVGLFITVLCLLSLIGCKHVESKFTYFDYMGDCGDTDPDWKYVFDLPIEAGTLGLLADAELRKKGFRQPYAVESWFSNSRSELMLCRTSQSPNGSCSGSWWSFTNENGFWELKETGSWVCVS